MAEITIEIGSSQVHTPLFVYFFCQKSFHSKHLIFYVNGRCLMDLNFEDFSGSAGVEFQDFRFLDGFGTGSDYIIRLVAGTTFSS